MGKDQFAPRARETIVQTRTWHVVTAMGGKGETVVAHRCSIRRGVLRFRTAFTESGEYEVVVAFAPADWRRVEMVEGETTTTPVHQNPPTASLGIRR